MPESCNVQWPVKSVSPGFTYSEQLHQRWLPVCIGGNPPIIRWINVGPSSLSEPFFQQSIECFRVPHRRNKECETSLSALMTVAAKFDQVEPAGIIFQMSRCGSTLLAKALGVAEGALALAEAQPIDRMMSWAASGVPHWAKIGATHLTPLNTVFARFQGAPEKHVVIKCGMSGIIALKAVQKIWPNVPRVILVRNPTEVLVSNLMKPPLWAGEWMRAQKESWLGLPPSTATSEGIESVYGWALGRFCAEALSALDDQCLVVDYEELTPESILAIGKHFNLSFSSDGERRVRELFRVDAKAPDRVFEEDKSAKRNAATDAVVRSVDRWMAKSYHQLCERGATLPRTLQQFTNSPFRNSVV